MPNYFYQDAVSSYVVVHTDIPGRGSLQVGYGRTPEQAVEDMVGTPLEAHSDPDEGLRWLALQDGIEYDPDDYEDVTDDIQAEVLRELEKEVGRASTWTGWEWTHDPGGVVTLGPGAQDDWDLWEEVRREDLTIDDLVAAGIDSEGMNQRAVEHELDAMAEAERGYGEDVQGSAEAAADLGISCVEAASSGKWALALKLAKEAAGLEGQYGDDPNYAPVVKICEKALALGL